MTTRVLAGVIVLLAAAYWALRLLATGCTGSACDWYVPFSLLLPVAALVLAGVAGIAAAYGARSRPGWTVALAACAALGSAGPVVAGFLIQGNNDALVVLSTALVLSVPVCIAAAAVVAPSRIS